jgi:hypothetical protein
MYENSEENLTIICTALTYLVQRVARVELRRLARPRAVVRVAHREGLHLETDHAPADKELACVCASGSE